MSNYTSYPFYSAYSHLTEVYGIEIDDDLFETYAMSAWNYIGNLHSRFYKTKIFPHLTEDGLFKARIPCNAYVIESITTNYEDFQRTDSFDEFIDSKSSVIETDNEAYKYDTPSIYQSGRLVNYQKEGDYLYFNEPYKELNVLYKGIYADEDGLPYLTFREMEAIAVYCVYTHFYKKAIATMDNNTLQMAQLFEQKWQKKCTQARNPEHINQNEMNTILDAKTSWDRKVYGLSFKPRVN